MSERRILTEVISIQRPKRRANDLQLSEPEKLNVRRCLHMLRRRFDGWQGAAEALGVKPQLACKAGGRKGNPSPALALRIARFVGVSVEEILSGAWPRPGSCPVCGRGGE